MTVFFRPMRPEDAAAVEVVEKASFAVPWSRESFWREVQNENTCYLVAVNIVGGGEEEIIGYAGCWLSFGEAQVTNIALLPKWRGKGIGARLLAALIAAVKKRLVAAMTLEVRPTNLPALALYRRFGFKEVGRRPHYYSDNGEDAIIMWNTALFSLSKIK